MTAQEIQRWINAFERGMFGGKSAGRAFCGYADIHNPFLCDIVDNDKAFTYIWVNYLGSKSL